jgi:NADH-quinone oxidoreductase subunit A
MVSPNEIAGYLALFVFCGFAFLFANLLLGRFLRPDLPNVEKLEVYECGEPAIGSSFVQFDLRFYVVALLFIIFDVEVAFFFPWATVFGKANQLAHLEDDKTEQVKAQRLKLSEELMPTGVPMHAKLQMGLMQVKDKAPGGAEVVPITSEAASSWAKIAFWDILIFFGVLMVGFAYVWRRGDIDWVRAYAHHLEPPVEPEKPLEKAKPHAPLAPVVVH